MSGNDIVKRLELVSAFFEVYCPRPKPEPLKVYYGYRRLTKKIVRKPSIAIYYENGKSRGNRRYIQQKIHIVYERFQTEKEQIDSEKITRMFSLFEYLINDDWNANIEGILYDNFMAEENNVSLQERELIRNLLRENIYEFYKDKISKTYQSTFKF